MMKENGLAEEGKDYFFEEIGADRVRALREGRYVASMLNTGAERGLADQGFYILDSIKHIYTNYAIMAAVRRQWADEHPDLVVRYLRAHLRALLWIEDPANAVAASDLGARPSGQRLNAPPAFAWEGLREMMAVRRDAGLLRGAVDPHRFADDRYYREATQAVTT
jgi:hypothetical protein